MNKSQPNEKDEKDEKNLLSDITDGKYKEYYLYYHRQSTDEAESQKNSLEYQEAENTRFAHREGFRIATITLSGFCKNGIIAEKHSGFFEDDTITFTEDGKAQFSIERPKFQRLLLFLSRGYFKGIVCLCWDRLSRNKADDTLVRKLMRKGIDFCFAYAKYEQSSAGELHMDVDSMFAAHHSRVTREKVTTTIRLSKSRGLCVSKAPIGYLNLGSMENKPHDPDRAPVIKRMFELYATGNWSLSDIARFANEQGLTTLPRRRKRTRKEILEDDIQVEDMPQIARPIAICMVSRIFSNWFYTGRVLDNNGNYIKSNSHEALVSDELFTKVQMILRRKQVSIHYDKKLDLPLRGIMRCASCNRVFTPYVKKGITYYSSRCKNDCSNPFRTFNSKFIERKIAKHAKKLAFTKKEIAQMDLKIAAQIALLQQETLREHENTERKKKRLREDLAYIETNRLVLLKTGVYDPETLIAEKHRINSDLATLGANKQISEEEIRETKAIVWKLSELVKNLIKIYFLANPHEKDEITRTMFSELFISENMLNFKVKSEFRCFENREFALGGPLDWISELSHEKDQISEAIKNLSNLEKNIN